MSIIITIIIFGIIVIIHEWGHMFVAKACGVNVEEFAVGMGPKICGFERNGTVYTIRALPLGGFCRMTDTSDEQRGIRGFNDASVAKRIAICIAGPLMNFVLAVIVMIVISMVTSTGTCIVSSLAEGFPAQAADIRVGDRIAAVNSKKVHISSELNFEIAENTQKSMELTVIRDGQKVVKNITAKYDEESGRYLIGIGMATRAPLLDIGLYEEIPEDMPKTTFLESVYDGYWNSIFIVKITFVSFAKLITGEIPASELSGPIGVTTVVDDSYKDSKQINLVAVIITMANIMALLSANLGIMNLLPIPALDGGRLLIFIIEIIRRKKIPPEKEGMINLAGFALLMTLAVFVAYHDILKLIR